MTEQYTVTMKNKHHPSLNKWTRWHWAKKDKVKKEFIQEITLKCNKYQQPNLDNAKIEVLYYFKNKRRRDKDNYVPKFILDGLVNAEIIKDDNDNNIFLNWKLLYDEDNPRTEIIIKEVQETNEKIQS